MVLSEHASLIVKARHRVGVHLENHLLRCSHQTGVANRAIARHQPLRRGDEVGQRYAGRSLRYRENLWQLPSAQSAAALASTAQDRAVSTPLGGNAV